MYAKYGKRIVDFSISFLAIVALSPVLFLLSIIGSIAMKGNPFFIQKRPGKDEKVFNLLKFRTMSNKKDNKGVLLSDKQRTTQYGKWLRETSLDELPELINILRGDMSFIGPRPLLVDYLPYYTEAERKRHMVRPGLTGLAQINGRNNAKWEERFKYDIEYSSHITMKEDLRILKSTIIKIIKHEDIVIAGNNEIEDLNIEREKWIRV